MWWSAASLCFAVFTTTDVPAQALTSAESRVWTKVRPSVVTLLNAGVANGLGVCVDKRGYFLAHQSVVPFPTVIARLSSGPQIELRRVAVDEPTQLALLQAISPGRTSFPAIQIGSEPEKVGGTLLAALPTGPLRAEFVSGEKYGVVNPSRRLVPLNELRFESHTAMVGGGLVFTMEGELLGVLGATLGTGENVNQRAMKSADSATTLGGGGFGGGSRLAAPRAVAPVQFGPGVLTVAYSVSSSVLHRVVDGLLSPSHKVVHPAIGVFCKDVEGGGAEVISLQPGSPAEKSGIRVGDVLLAIGEAAIKNQFDVARVTMRLRVGTSIEVRIRRGTAEQIVLVTVGAS